MTYSLKDMLDDLGQITYLKTLVKELTQLCLPKAENEKNYTDMMTSRALQAEILP